MVIYIVEQYYVTLDDVNLVDYQVYTSKDKALSDYPECITDSTHEDAVNAMLSSSDTECTLLVQVDLNNA